MADKSRYVSAIFNCIFYVIVIRLKGCQRVASRQPFFLGARSSALLRRIGRPLRLKLQSWQRRHKPLRSILGYNGAAPQLLRLQAVLPDRVVNPVLADADHAGELGGRVRYLRISHVEFPCQFDTDGGGHRRSTKKNDDLPRTSIARAQLFQCWRRFLRTGGELVIGLWQGRFYGLFYADRRNYWAPPRLRRDMV